MKRPVALIVYAVAILFMTTGAFADNTVAVTQAAALNGTNFGLEVILDGTNTIAFVSSDHPNQEKVYRARFWIDQRQLQIPLGNAASNHLRYFIGIDAQPVTPGTAQHIIGFLTKSDQDGGYHFIVWVREDDGTFQLGGNIFLGNNFPRQVEVEWAAASAPGANDGMIQISRVDNPAQTSGIANVDNDQKEVDRFEIGVFANPIPLSDTYYFDEFESFRTLAP